MIVWRFEVAADRRAEFERAYGSTGDWAQLFARSPDYLGTSILEMLAGGSPISPPIARYLLRRFRGADAATTPARPDLPRLSEREGQVLELIVKGFSYAEIARLIGVSTHTVTTHVRGIYGKLEVHSRGEAVYEAVQLGLVRIEED